MELRKARLKDARELLRWRNDDLTRKYSRNPEVILWEEHLLWFNTTNRLIYIAEINGTPIGTVQGEKKEGGIELSWTISPVFRGHDYGCEMVLQFVKEIIPGEKIFAYIKEGNIASEKIAKALNLHKDSSGIWKE